MQLYCGDLDYKSYFGCEFSVNLLQYCQIMELFVSSSSQCLIGTVIHHIITSSQDRRCQCNSPVIIDFIGVKDNICCVTPVIERFRPLLSLTDKAHLQALGTLRHRFLG